MDARTQHVKYVNKLLDRLPLSSGVLQKSVFSPSIFNLFLNQLLISLPADEYVAYADDVTLVTISSTSSEVFNQCSYY